MYIELSQLIFAQRWRKDSASAANWIGTHSRTHALRVFCFGLIFFYSGIPVSLYLLRYYMPLFFFALTVILSLPFFSSGFVSLTLFWNYEVIGGSRVIRGSSYYDTETLQQLFQEHFGERVMVDTATDASVPKVSAATAPQEG